MYKKNKISIKKYVVLCYNVIVGHFHNILEVVIVMWSFIGGSILIDCLKIERRKNEK